MADPSVPAGISKMPSLLRRRGIKDLSVGTYGFIGLEFVHVDSDWDTWVSDPGVVHLLPSVKYPCLLVRRADRSYQLGIIRDFLPEDWEGFVVDFQAPNRKHRALHSPQIGATIFPVTAVAYGTLDSMLRRVDRHGESDG